MSKKSVGEVSVLISAQGQSAINEFGRVDNALRRSVSRMNAEVSKFSKSVGKKFSLGGIGGSVLSGLGVGSGFAVAQTAVNSISSQWEKAADYAKKVEDSTARQLANTTAAIKARMTEAQRELYLQKEIERTARQLSQWQGSSQSFSILEPGKWAENFRQFLNDTDKSELATEKINELTEALGSLGTELETIKRKKLDDTIARNLSITGVLGSQVTRRGNADMQLDEAINGPMGSEQRTKLINQLYKERAHYLEQIATMPFGTDGNEARAAAEKNLADATERLIPLMKEQVQLGFDIGNAMASSFEDAILEAKGLRETVNGLLKDIAQIAMRSAITAPLGNWLGGMFSGFFGGGKARGGGIEPGVTYRVNEEGQEYFKSNVGGTMMPVGASPKQGGARGDTFIFNNSYAPGVTPQNLAMALAMSERNTIAKIADAKRRRTPMGAAMA